MLLTRRHCDILEALDISDPPSPSSVKSSPKDTTFLPRCLDTPLYLRDMEYRDMALDVATSTVARQEM